VSRYDLATVVVSDGLAPGERVVDAGVQTLRPGQKVLVLGSDPADAHRTGQQSSRVLDDQGLGGTG